MEKNMPESRIKIFLLVSSFLAMLLMVLSALDENVSGLWRGIQKDYRQTLIEKAKDDKSREAAERMEIRLRQVVLPDLALMDRCVTCHLGSDNPMMADAALPLRAHSGEFLRDHPVERFGCTVCHDGQGRAVEKMAAHGQVRHWPAPRLRGEAAYTTCGRCHYENDLYGAESDLYYAEAASLTPIDEAELTTSVMGNPSIAGGKGLVIESGCMGCHKYRSRGGVLGPDITYVGDKISHDFDFSHIDGEHTVYGWLFEHFKTPQTVTPGTLMPDLQFSDEQARDLTAYMLSLHRKKMPTTYTPPPPELSGIPAGGKHLYAMFCSACHGKYGHGSTVRDVLDIQSVDSPPELMVPSLNHPDTLAVASNDYLDYILRNGRPGTTMIAWQNPASAVESEEGTDLGEGGLLPDEIERLTLHLRSWQAPGADLSAVTVSRGDLDMGQAPYRFQCAACHGTRGQGDIGPSLNSPGFLGVASDEFLAKTISGGRPNTAMPGWKQIDSQQLSDLVTLMRDWHQPKNERAQALRLARGQRNTAAVSANIGRILYQANCTMCHGSKGEGDLGPSLSTREFLTLAGNDYLFETIASGRPGTGMPAWRGMASEDIASLIRFLRTWQTTPSRTLPRKILHGDWDTGRFLFAGLCAGCHGNHAEGSVGPQLNNPVFLESASDSMLEYWIAYGKTDTPMRPFKKGAQGTAELSDRQMVDIVSYLRSLERSERISVMKSPFGRPELGRIWFAVACASCHGDQGQGSSGPALGNQAFLQAASDGFLMATLARGRDGTEMRPLKKSPQSIVSLSSDQINDVVAFLRSLEIEPLGSAIPHRFVIPWDLGHGREVYLSNCSGCHGNRGKAENKEVRVSAWAPELNNDRFLAAATDGFLQATIVRGRMGTAMRPFGVGFQGLVDLSAKDIDDTVAYIRQWSSLTGSPMTIPAELGLVTAHSKEPENSPLSE